MRTQHIQGWQVQRLGRCPVLFDVQHPFTDCEKALLLAFKAFGFHYFRTPSRTCLLNHSCAARTHYIRVAGAVGSGEVQDILRKAREQMLKEEGTVA